MEGTKFWWGVAAFFLGGLATQFNGWITYQRQRRDKKADAQAALIQRREQFELTQLTDLHAALTELFSQALSRAAHRFHGTDASEAEQVYDEVNLRVNALVGLTLDDSIRGLAQTAHGTIALMNVGPNQDVVEPSTPIDGGRHLGRAQLAISARIREIYTSDGYGQT